MKLLNFTFVMMLPFLGFSAIAESLDIPTYLDKSFQGFRTSRSHNSWWVKHDAEKSAQVYDMNIDVPLAAWLMPVSRWIERVKPTACTWTANLSYDPQYANYLPGEIPCGVVQQQANAKTLYQVDLPQQQFLSNGWLYTVESGSLQVEIARNGLSGPVSDLNVGGEPAPNQSSAYFEDDVRVGNSGKVLSLCARIPGVDAGVTFAPRQVTAVKPGRPPQFESFTYSAASQASTFQYSEICQNLKINSDPDLMPNEASLPSIQGLASQVQPPQNDFESEMVTRDSAAIQMKLANDGLLSSQDPNNEVTDGSWSARLMAEQFSGQVGSQIATQSRHILERANVPLDETSFRQQLSDRCRLLKLSRTDNDKAWTDKMQSFCNGMIPKVGFRFVKLQPSAIAKCQVGSAGAFDMITPDQQYARWWARQCDVSSHVRMTLPDNLTEYKAEFETLLRMVGKNVQPCSPWDAHMKDLKIDGYEIWPLLEQLEQNGSERLSESDWQSFVPDALAKMHAAELP